MHPKISPELHTDLPKILLPGICAQGFRWIVPAVKPSEPTLVMSSNWLWSWLQELWRYSRGGEYKTWYDNSTTVTHKKWENGEELDGEFLQTVEDWDHQPKHKTSVALKSMKSMKLWIQKQKNGEERLLESTGGQTLVSIYFQLGKMPFHQSEIHHYTRAALL